MKKNEILYILGYFFILFPTYFSEVVIFQPLLQVTMYLGIIILSILFIVSKIKENIINKKEFWFLFMCFIFSLFSFICSGSACGRCSHRSAYPGKVEKVPLYLPCADDARSNGSRT